MVAKKTSKRIRLIIFIIALICLGFGFMIAKVDDPANSKPLDPVEIPLNLNNNS